MEQDCGNKVVDYLTLEGIRVTYVVTNTEESYHDNFGQEFETRRKARRSISQRDVFLRSSSRRGQQDSLSINGWQGVQESFVCRNGYYRTGLQWLGFLECANGYRAGRFASAKHGGKIGGTVNQFGGKANFPDTKSEGDDGQSDTVVLPRLRQEFLSRDRGVTRNLPARSQTGVIPAVNQFTNLRQSLFIGGLPRYNCLLISSPSISRGNQW